MVSELTALLRSTQRTPDFALRRQRSRRQAQLMQHCVVGRRSRSTVGVLGLLQVLYDLDRVAIGVGGPGDQESV